MDIAVELGRLPGHACLEVVNLPEELAGFTRKSIPVSCSHSSCLLNGATTADLLADTGVCCSQRF